MIDNYRQATNIELIGMGYYHPIFPLIPKEDWDEQLQMGVDVFKKLFGKRPVGFWPSEMAFCMEMIPALKKAGYKYVIVDHVHVHPKGENKVLDPFTPYWASFEGETIIVIPRNRDLSNAQESGFNPEWFLQETERKIFVSPAPQSPRLVTTWSDGENGGWFRQIDENSGFFGYFWSPLLKKIRSGDAKAKTVRISDFLKKHPPIEYADVNTGAWNVASTSGYDFSQWNGSQSQKKAIEELIKISKRYWELKNQKLSKSQANQLGEARKFILDAETSCYLFWGEAWLPKLYERLELAKNYLW
jgi:alpha-amylase/alpha-mannosidase (GH57 family)